MSVIKVTIDNEYIELTEQATIKTFLADEFNNQILFNPLTDYDDFTFKVTIVKRDIAP